MEESVRKMLLKAQQDGRRRGNRWYQRYFEIAILLKVNQCKNIPEVLKHLNDTYNLSRAYHTETIARSAYQSMLLVIKDLELR